MLFQTTCIITGYCSAFLVFSASPKRRIETIHCTGAVPNEYGRRTMKMSIGMDLLQGTVHGMFGLRDRDGTGTVAEQKGTIANP